MERQVQMKLEMLFGICVPAMVMDLRIQLAFQASALAHPLFLHYACLQGFQIGVSSSRHTSWFPSSFLGSLPTFLLRRPRREGEQNHPQATWSPNPTQTGQGTDPRLFTWKSSPQGGDTAGAGVRFSFQQNLKLGVLRFPWTHGPLWCLLNIQILSPPELPKT